MQGADMRGRQLRIDEVLRLWNSLDVPPVAIRRFNYEKDYPNDAWANKDGSRYRFEISNPQRTTAWHLCKGIIATNQEAHSLFSIHAFLTEEASGYKGIGVNDLDYQVRTVLLKIDPRPGSYWSRNSRTVLPPLPDSIALSERNEGEGSWQTVIEDAARTWKEISEKLAIVRIPDFMSEDDEDLKQWHADLRQRNEEREHAEYERLKRKYEGNNH
jgi:hypothetical protein